MTAGGHSFGGSSLALLLLKHHSGDGAILLQRFEVRGKGAQRFAKARDVQSQGLRVIREACSTKNLTDGWSIHFVPPAPAQESCAVSLAVVDKPDPISPKLNLAFLEYTQSRNFLVDPARVRTPTDKARVERQVQYVRNDFFRGERFRSVEEGRIEAERWSLEQAGKRIHGRTRVRPLDRFENEERSVLRPAPTEPYDSPRWTKHTVGRDHAIVVGYALYSVGGR